MPADEPEPVPGNSARPGRADLVIDNISRLVTLARGAAAGAEGPLGVITHAALAARAGRIIWCGPAADLSAAMSAESARHIDTSGHAVIPGFVDSHTHFVFAGDRAEEFQLRHAGVSYEELARQGRGILSTVRATRAAAPEALRASGAARLRSLRRPRHHHRGGQDRLRAGPCVGVPLPRRDGRPRQRPGPARRCSHVSGRAYLCHLSCETPGGRAKYVDLVCDEMLPAFAGRARFCDVFCERTAFTVDETRRILERATNLGYLLKIHANQLSASGGAAIAAELGAVSADHLDFASDTDLVGPRGRRRRGHFASRLLLRALNALPLWTPHRRRRAAHWARHRL